MDKKECLNKLMAYIFKKKTWEEISQRVNISNLKPYSWYIFPEDDYCVGAIIYIPESQLHSITRELKPMLDIETYQNRKIGLLIDTMLAMLVKAENHNKII